MRRAVIIELHWLATDSKKLQGRGKCYEGEYFKLKIK